MTTPVFPPRRGYTWTDRVDFGVRCGDCIAYRRVTRPTRAACVAELRHDGWRNTVARGWLCSCCLFNRKRKRAAKGT